MKHTEIIWRTVSFKDIPVLVWQYRDIIGAVASPEGVLFGPFDWDKIEDMLMDQIEIIESMRHGH